MGSLQTGSLIVDGTYWALPFLDFLLFNSLRSFRGGSSFPFEHAVACSSKTRYTLVMKNEPLATKLPPDLKKTLDAVCARLGLRKNFVIESALREKLEELMDAEDLREAISEATGFHTWESVKGAAAKSPK